MMMMEGDWIVMLFKLVKFNSLYAYGNNALNISRTIFRLGLHEFTIYNMSNIKYWPQF